VKLTSGSTGEPGGVAIAADALAADDDQLARTMGLAAEDRFLAAIPWSHSYGLSSLVLPALRRGSLLILPEDGGPWAPLAAARALGATVMPTVPVYLRTVAEIAPASAWPATLTTVISAGARLSPEDARRFRDVFGRTVHVFYGATECGGITYDRAGGAAERGTVGTPVDGVAVMLEGDDAARAGTVTVASAAVALRHVPAPDPSLRDGVFRSADLAETTAAGELRLIGRVDALINVDGKKVQPREVEAVLCAMPGVREAVVLGVRA
jgi:long-chain acyl-CoA synthetase